MNGMNKRIAALLLILTAAFGAGFFVNTARLSKTAVYSATLSTVTSVEDGIERVDFVDALGNVTDAADRGYATIVRYPDENGRLIREEYRRADGSLARLSSGCSAVERTYNADGRCERQVYLNAEGELVNIPSGYACVTFTYNDEGLTDTQRYYDAKGRPARLWMGASGLRIIYGREVTTVYLGADGMPMQTEAGYTMIRRSFDGQGRVLRECYLDGAQEPVKSTKGEYGVEYAYDEEGRVASETYLGADGNAMDLPRGYSAVRFTYTASGKKTGEYYYDAEGNPARMLGRYHGVNLTGSRRIYQDEMGKTVFLPDAFLRENEWVVVLSGALLCALALILPLSFRRVLMGFYVVFILFMTLMHRESGDSRARMELFWSYRRFLTNASMRSSICNNILLFLPFGALLRSLTRRKRMLILIPLLSVLIELTQFFTGLGLCEIDDLISNTLGGLLGWSLIWLVQFFQREKTD